MNDPTLNQDEIDALLADIDLDGPAGGGAAAPAAAPVAADDPFGALEMGAGAAEPAPADDFGDMFSSPAPAPAPAPEHHAAPPAPAAHFDAGDIPQGNLQVLLDVPLEVVVELGRTEMQIKDILNLAQGAVVELDRMAGEPINILVNGKLVAKGEVVVVDENFGIRITNIISPMERLTQLN